MLIRRNFSFIALCLLLSLLTSCRSNQPAIPTFAVPTTAATIEPTPTAVATPMADPGSATENAASATSTAPESAAADAPELADMVTVISRAEGLEHFVGLAEQVGLTDLLSSDGPFTVLLPTNAAFDQLPTAVREDTALMTAILREHIVEGTYLLDEMTTPATVTTLYGDDLSLLVGQTGGTILGSNVLAGDFAVKNGIIHIIDTVILPPDLETQILALYEPVAGETLQPMQGNIHIANNETSPIAYAGTPPTSGPHYPNIAPWQVFAEPWRYEQLIHNLEDSGVVIYYQCPDGCPDLVQQLRDLAQPLIDSGRHVLVAPNDPTWTTPTGEQPHQDMGAPIAVTAWRRTLKLDAFDANQISAFIEAFEGIDHHVKG